MKYILSNEEEVILRKALGKELVSILSLDGYWCNPYYSSVILSFLGGFNIKITAKRVNANNEDSLHYLSVSSVEAIDGIFDGEKIFAEEINTRKVESIEIITDCFKYAKSTLDLDIDNGIIFRDSDNNTYAFYINERDNFISLTTNKPFASCLTKAHLRNEFAIFDKETKNIPEITRTSRYLEYDYQLEDILKPLDSREYLGDGGDAYIRKDFKKAFANYNLAAAMGNMDAVSNLGYCYMYGNGVEKNFELALEYFKLAASNDNIDALYKLGTFYASEKYNMQNFAIADKFFDRAFSLAKSQHRLSLYPSLLLVVAKEKMPSGRNAEDREEALELLAIAHESFSFEILKGADFYSKHLEETKELINNECFKSLDEKYVKQILISHNVVDQELESTPYKEIPLSKIDDLISFHDSSLLKITYNKTEKTLTVIIDQSYESFSDEKLWKYMPEHGPIQFKFKNVEKYDGSKIERCDLDIYDEGYVNDSFVFHFYNPKINECETVPIKASSVEITLKKKEQY